MTIIGINEVARKCMTDDGMRKNQIEEAIELAALAHNGQLRKGTDIPYITHPFAVGLMLMDTGCSESVVIAGILHDTVEDTDLTLDHIRINFGDSVADIVDGCSEDKTLKWTARKTERIEALKSASTEVCIVTCADKLHNLRTVISEFEDIGNEVWDRFHGGFEAQSWYYQSILGSLNSHIGSSVEGKCKSKTDKQLNHIFRQLEQAVTYLFDN